MGARRLRGHVETLFSLSGLVWLLLSALYRHTNASRNCLRLTCQRTAVDAITSTSNQISEWPIPNAPRSNIRCRRNKSLGGGCDQDEGGGGLHGVSMYGRGAGGGWRRTLVVQVKVLEDENYGNIWWVNVRHNLPRVTCLWVMSQLGGEGTQWWLIK